MRSIRGGSWGWWCAGWRRDSLLDSYHAERHPVAARVLQNTMAQVALGRSDARSGALRDMVAGLLRHDGPRREVVGMIPGLDIVYDLGSETQGLGHAGLGGGCRMSSWWVAGGFRACCTGRGPCC